MLRVLGALAIAAAVLSGCGAFAASNPNGSTRAGGTVLPRFPQAHRAASAVCTAAQLAGRLPPIIHRPASLPSGRPAPLLIALHGATGTPQRMEGLSHFEELSDQRGFVVAFLAACDLQHPWNSANDVSYVGSMITQMTNSPSLAGRIDPARVYITGFSAGGAETWLDACHLSRQIAAIAVVSDAMNGQLYSSCKVSKPVPELLMVGSKDGTRWTGIADRLPNPFQTTSLWRRLDGCRAGVSHVEQVSVVTQQTWTDCTDGSAVALYVVHGAGHVWPPYGSNAPRNYSASAAVWSFLSGFRAASTSLTGADVRLNAVHVKTKHRRAVLEVGLTFRESLTVALDFGSGRLSRPLRRQVRLSGTTPGQSTVALAIPATVPGGKYTLSVALTDPYGRSVTLRRTATVP